MWIILARKVRSFAGLSIFAKLWLLPVWLALGLSRALILAMSFRRLAPHLGESLGVSTWTPITDEQQRARALAIGRTVRLAAKYSPWDSNCFAQAVVARLLLGVYGVPYALYFGLARDPQTRAASAHAWVRSGPVAVTGGASFGQFTVVGVFATPGLAQT